jgi:hypothetical protein
VSAGVNWPARPRCTIVQVSDPHVPADGFLFDRVDACARVQASVEMIAAAGAHLLGREPEPGPLDEVVRVGVSG